MGGFVGQGLPDPDDVGGDSPLDAEAPPLNDKADDEGDSQASDEDAPDDAAADDAGTDDVSVGDDDGTDEGVSPTFDKLVKEKYGGDKEAFARAYIEQANSMSDLAGEVRGIKEFIQGQQAEAATPKLSQEEIQQRIADSPEVQEASEELESIEEDIKAEQVQYRTLVTEVGKAERLVARIEGKLESAYDENKPGIKAELSAAQAALDRLTDKFQSSQRNLRKLGSTFKRAQRSMEKAERSVRNSIEGEVRQRREDASNAQAVRMEFATAMLEEAQARKIDPKSSRYRTLFDSVQSRLWAYTQTLPEDADPIDIPMAVKLLTKEYFDAGFGGPSFQQSSTDKRRATTRKGAPAQRTDDADRSTKGGKTVVKDAAWWDRRAAKLLGG